MKVRQKRKYRRRTKITKASLKHVRLVVDGNLHIGGGGIDIGDDGVVNVHGNMTVTDMNATMPKNVCLCGDKDQTISAPPLGWNPMPRLTPEMMHEVVRAALRLHRKFSKMMVKKRKRGGKKVR